VTAIIFLCAAIRAEIADMNRKCDDFPVRAPAVQDRLAKVCVLLGEIEAHGAKEKKAAND